MNCVDAVNLEPELPGHMPKEMFEEIKRLVLADDVDGLSELLRIIVRQTKEGIITRLTLAAAEEFAKDGGKEK